MNSSNVCSGRGSCVSPDVCLCDIGFSGSICQTTPTPTPTPSPTPTSSPTSTLTPTPTSIMVNNTSSPQRSNSSTTSQAPTTTSQTTITTSVPTTTYQNSTTSPAFEGPIVSMISPLLATFDDFIIVQGSNFNFSNLACIFVVNDTTGFLVYNTTPVVISSTECWCKITFNAMNNDIVYVIVNFIGSSASFNQRTPMFLYNAPVQIDGSAGNIPITDLSSFNCGDGGSDSIPGSVGCPQNMTVANNELILSTNFVAETRYRRAIRSTTSFAVRDQEGVIDFVIVCISKLFDV